MNRNPISGGGFTALQKLKTEYKGIEISYNPNRMVWEFEIDSVKRKADTVENAIRAIDAPRKKKPAFERFPAFLGERWSNDFAAVTVTSVCDLSESGIPTFVMCVPRNDPEGEFNINPGQSRSKEHVCNIYPNTDQNRELIKQIKVLKEQAKEIEKKMVMLKGKMKHWDPKAVVDVEKKPE